VGEIDACNPESVSKSQLVEWESEGVVEVWGVRDDMPEVMNSSSIVCLPSTYGEGLPKVLLEAASCAKPVVAYDIAGCREIVIDGENGYLISAKDVLALTRAIETLLQNKNLQKQMGDKGREIVVKQFSQEIVAEETQQVWKEVLA
jgi:glycosyltransferase involved in cell wall biosynthesis